MEHTILPDALRPYAELVVAIAAALAIFIVGWLASKWAHRLVLGVFRRRKVDESLARFLASLGQYAILAMAVIAALSEVGIETTSIIAIFASASLAIGLALQGSLSNFASGVLLLLFRPITVGDYVKIGGYDGTVDEIGIFSTTIVTPANETVVVPNTKITSDSIVNFTRRGTRRCRIEIGVAYGVEIGPVIAALEAATRRVPAILGDPAPSVVFTGFGASSLDFAVMAWARNQDFMQVQHDLRQAIYEALAGASIEIPFPQVVVHQAA